MTTIKDIANRLGISVSTVSKGLNGARDISPELRQVVLDTAAEMGYQTKRMKKETHRKLCILVADMDYEEVGCFGYDLVLGFKQAAYREKWGVQINRITPDIQSTEKYDSYILENGFLGAFLLGFSFRDTWMEQLSITNIPTVLFDDYIRRNPSVGYVGTDNFEGIGMAVEHLTALGHKKIAFLNGFLSSGGFEQRQNAFLIHMEKYGLPLDKELMADGHYTVESIKEHTSHFLRSGATAILCGNDTIAAVVIAECNRLGFSVPDDVSVVGFDDIPASAHLLPPLTTIRQNRLELGKSGYYTLASLLNQVPISRTLLRAQLIARSSTAPCRTRT